MAQKRSMCVYSVKIVSCSRKNKIKLWYKKKISDCSKNNYKTNTISNLIPKFFYRLVWWLPSRPHPRDWAPDLPHPGGSHLRGHRPYLRGSSKGSSHIWRQRWPDENLVNYILQINIFLFCFLLLRRSLLKISSFIINLVFCNKDKISCCFSKHMQVE